MVKIEVKSYGDGQQIFCGCFFLGGRFYQHLLSNAESTIRKLRNIYTTVAKINLEGKNEIETI